MIYATHSYADLAARVAALARLPIGEVETRLFPDGERYLRLISDPASRDIVVLGGTVTEPETLSSISTPRGSPSISKARCAPCSSRPGRWSSPA